MTHLDPMLMKLITNGLRQTMCPCFLLFLEHPQGGFTCCTWQCESLVHDLTVCCPVSEGWGSDHIARVGITLQGLLTLICSVRLLWSFWLCLIIPSSAVWVLDCYFFAFLLITFKMRRVFLCGYLWSLWGHNQEFVGVHIHQRSYNLVINLCSRFSPFWGQ